MTDLTALAVGLSIFLLLYGAATPWAPPFVRLFVHVVMLGALLATASHSGVALGFAMPGGWWRWMLVLPVVLPVGSGVMAWAWPRWVPSRKARTWRARSTWLFLFELFPRLIVTTVLLEEVAFRGLLFGAASEASGGAVPAALVSSSVFGLWHISPTIVEAREEGVTVTTSLIATRVIATALVGLGLAYLRVARDSLWLPIVVHFAINVAGMVAAFVASRRLQEEAV